MHPQKLLPRGKRAGNCLIGRLCPSAVSRMGEVTLFMQGDPARQEGCLGVLCPQRALEHPEALQGTRNGCRNFQALTQERLQKLRNSRRL